MSMTPFPRYLALLAVTLLVGCQQPLGAPDTFGVTVTPGAAVEPLPAALTGGQPMPQGSYVPNELIVQLSPGAETEKALSGFTSLGVLPLSNRFAGIQVPEGMSLTEAHDELVSRPGVLGVSLNLIVQGSAPEPPTPARYTEQWAHQVTGIAAYWQAHDRVDAGQVIVAVLDTGIAPTHPAFAGRLIAPQNFTPDNEADPSDPTDGHGHGTHVSGIIGAAGDQVVGVAPDVQLMPVKVMANSNRGSTFGIAQGLSYAIGLDPDGPEGPRTALPAEVASRVRVVNMSLGSGSRGISAVYEAVLAEAWNQGIVVVVAAGNDGMEVASPANSPFALSVSSTSPYRLGDRIWEWLSGFSNRGERIDLAAPGGQILSTLPNFAYTNPRGVPQPQDYGNNSGTSMAAPYIAGVAALVAAQYPRQAEEDPGRYVEKVKEHLYATADDLGAPGRDPKYGWGRVNVLKALTTSFPATLPQ